MIRERSQLAASLLLQAQQLRLEKNVSLCTHSHSYILYGAWNRRLLPQRPVCMCGVGVVCVFDMWMWVLCVLLVYGVCVGERSAATGEENQS